MDDNVRLVFKIMQQRLSKRGDIHLRDSKRQFLRQKLYDTFRSEDDSQAKSVTDSKQQDVRKDGHGFFIDKTKGSEINSSHDACTDIETIDLSELAEKAGVEEKSASDGEKCSRKKNKRDGLSSKLSTKVSTKDVYINVDPYKNPGGHKPVKKGELVHNEPKVMQKSVITNEFEKQDSIESDHKSRRQRKKERKLEREKTKGDKWFHMPAVELTEEQKAGLQVLQMRKALDPKRFYKANETSVQPKFVQFGRVVESSADFYDSRIPKKQRKATIVEELLADTEFRKYNKRKYEEIQEARRIGKGPYTHMKRLKKHKK